MQINIMILNYYADDEAWSYDELGPREFETLPPVGSYVTLEREQWIRTFKVDAVALHSPLSEERGYNATAYLEYVGVHVGGETSIMNEQARKNSDVNVNMGLSQIDWRELRAVVNGESDADI